MYSRGSSTSYKNNVSLIPKDSVSLKDRLYILDSYKETDEEQTNNLMDFVNTEDEGKIIVADYEGNSKAASKISESMNIDAGNAVTEKAVSDYVKETTLSKQSIATSPDEINPSDEKATSEKAVVEGLSFNIIK